MDVIKIKKIQAVKKYKRNEVVNNVLFYSLTVLTCSVLCSIPLWLPYLSSSMKFFVFVYVPKISSFFFNSKFMFIFGNLIVVALIGESKIFYSRRHSENYHNEYISISQVFQNFYAPKENKIEHLEIYSVERKQSNNGEDVEEERKQWIQEKLDVKKELEITLPNEDFNKRADDFIARVNKLMRLEASESVRDY